MWLGFGEQASHLRGLWVAREAEKLWKRGSSRGEDELLRQEGMRKKRDRMGKLGRSREGCRQVGLVL